MQPWELGTLQHKQFCGLSFMIQRWLTDLPLDIRIKEGQHITPCRHRLCEDIMLYILGIYPDMKMQLCHMPCRWYRFIHHVHGLPVEISMKNHAHHQQLHLLHRKTTGLIESTRMQQFKNIMFLICFHKLSLDLGLFIKCT